MNVNVKCHEGVTLWSPQLIDKDLNRLCTSLSRFIIEHEEINFLDPALNLNNAGF